MRTSVVLSLVGLLFSAGAMAQVLGGHAGSNPTAPTGSRPVAERENLEKAMERFLKDPSGFMRREGTAFNDRVRREKPELSDKVERSTDAYQRAYDAFVSWFNENVKGRRVEDLAQDVRSELMRRSKELRDLEGALLDLLAADDIKSLWEQFRKNPERFARDKADLLIKKLRDEHSERADMLAKMFDDYKEQSAKFRRFVDENVAGKSTNQLSKDTIDELRTRSASLRGIETRITDIIGDLVKQKEQVEQTLKSLPDRLKPIANDIQRLKDEDAKRAERDAREFLEKKKKEANRDLRKILDDLRNKR